MSNSWTFAIFWVYNPCTPNFNVNTKILIEIPLIFLNVPSSLLIHQLQLHIFHLRSVNQFKWYVNLPVPSPFPTLHQDCKVKINGKPDSCPPPQIIVFVNFVSIPSCSVYWLLMGQELRHPYFIKFHPLWNPPVSTHPWVGWDGCVSPSLQESL